MNNNFNSTEKQYELAKKRTELSYQRTSQSYFRTALTCISVAFAFIKLDKKHPFDGFTIFLFVIALACILASILIFTFMKIFFNKIDKKQKM